MNHIENIEKQRELLARIPQTAGHSKRQWLQDQAKQYGAIECKCGHVYESSLGKYGCPNCSH